MNSASLNTGYGFSLSRHLRHVVLWGGALLFAAVALFVAVSEVSAQEPPPDLDGSLGYDSFTTCWRVGADAGGFAGVPSRFGSGYDWAWPGCSSPGDPSKSCGPSTLFGSGPNAGLFSDPVALPLSGAAPGSFFSIFPANLDSVLNVSGAEAIAYVPNPTATTDFVYRPAYRQFSLPTQVPPTAAFAPPAVAAEVPERNCFVDLESSLTSLLSSSCRNGIPVFHSRRDYLNNLYGVVDQDGVTGYADALQEGRRATSYRLQSRFSYVGVTPTSTPPVPAPPWWSSADSWQRVPAREAAHFDLGWLHPDFPEGGLAVDYAYLLRQQHYMNAELLANLRSYSTDGERVTRGIRSTPHAWVFNGLTTITCATGSTCTLSVDMNQVAVRQINVVYLEVNFNPAYNRVASAVENRLPGSGGHSPPVPFDGAVPTHTPTSGAGPNPDLLGNQTYHPEYYYYDVRGVRHPSFVEDDPPDPARLQVGQLAGTRAVAYHDREVYPTPDDLIFDHGHASDAEYVGYIQDYPDTKYDSLVVQMRLPAIYRQDPVVDYSVTEPRGARPRQVSLFGSEHGQPIMRPRVTAAVPPHIAPTVQYANIDGLEVVAAYEQMAMPAAPDASVFPFSNWIGNWPTQSGPPPTNCLPTPFPENYPFEYHLSFAEAGYDDVLDLPLVSGQFPMDDFCSGVLLGEGQYVGPHYVQDAFWFRWPVLYSDIAWYLFELDEFNKAVADDPAAIDRVIGHSGMGSKIGVQPAYQLDPAMMGYWFDGVPQAYDPSPGPAPRVPHRWLPGRDVWGDVEEHLYALLDNHRNTVPVVEDDILLDRALQPSSMGVIEPLDGLPWSAEATRLVTRAWQGGYFVYGGREMDYAGDASSWRAVWYPSSAGNYEYGVFGGGAVRPLHSDSSVQGGQQAYHGLSFVPMRTPVWDNTWADVDNEIFYDPGGVLVKRGVAGVADPGTNSLAEWQISDGQSMSVSGVAQGGVDDRVRLGLAEPGSHYAYRQAIQWPDLGINPNRSHLLVTLYYEAKLGDPFYLVEQVSSPSDPNLRYDAVGVVPRIQMRPVMCRTFVQPLGVNTGPKDRSFWDQVYDFQDKYLSPGAHFSFLWGQTFGRAGRAATEEGTRVVADLLEGWIDNLTEWVERQSKAAITATQSEPMQGTCTVLAETDRVVGLGSSGAAARSPEGKKKLIEKCAEERALKEQAASSCISTGEGDDGECPTLPVMALRVADVRYDGGPASVNVDGVIEPDEPLRSTGYYYRRHDYLGSSEHAYHPRIVRHEYTKGGEAPVYGWDLLPTVPDGSRGLGTVCPPYTPQQTDYTMAQIASGNYDPGLLPLQEVQSMYDTDLCRPQFVELRCDVFSAGAGEYGRAPGGECVSKPSGAVDPPLTAMLVWEPRGVPPVEDRMTNETYYEFEFTLPPDVGAYNFDYRRLRGAAARRISQDSLLGPGATGWSHSGEYVSGDTGAASAPADVYVPLEDYAVVVGQESVVTYRLPARWHRTPADSWSDVLLGNVLDKEDDLADRLPFGHLGALSPNAFFSDYSADVVFDECEVAHDNSPPAGAIGMPSTTFTGVDDCQLYLSRTYFGTVHGWLHHWWRPAGDSANAAELSFRSLYYDLMQGLPLYGDLTYRVRMRSVKDDGEKVVHGGWSNSLELGPGTMCPVVNRETQETVWNDLGCGRYAKSAGSLNQSTSADATLGYTWFWSMVGSDLCTSWFDSTPAKFTWGHPVVVRGWSVVWILAITALSLMIFWQGIRMTYDMWLHGGWTNQRDPGFREMVPRFIIAIILSAASLWICRLVIVLASHVSCYVAKSLDISLWQIVFGFFVSLAGYVGFAIPSLAGLGPAALLILLGLLVAVVGFFLIIFGKLMFQFVLRLALLSVLVVLSPLAFMLLASPDTEGQFKKWLDMFVVTIVTQSIQLVVLFVGFGLFSFYTVGEGGIGYFEGSTAIIGVIMALAVMYLATQVPVLMDRYLGRDYSGGGTVVESAVTAARPR